MFDAINDSNSNEFRDAVCIDTKRIYDSCMDRDCLEDLRVFFGRGNQELFQNAVSCRVKSAEVVNVLVDVEPVNFNRGFYSCDLSYFFKVNAEACMSQSRIPVDLTGICSFRKKVILCGTDAYVKTFSSNHNDENGIELPLLSNLPECKLQCVDPVILEWKICNIKNRCDQTSFIPINVQSIIGEQISNEGCKGLYVTLGLFSITQLVKDVQLTVPAFDFCLPEKECPTSSESPCDLFGKLKFPTEEFFPESYLERDDECKCEQCKNKYKCGNCKHNHNNESNFSCDNDDE